MNNLKGAVTVIIPFFGPGRLDVQSLARDVLSIGGHTIREVIIVDNNPRPRLGECFNDSRVKILHEPHRGSYAARNAGVLHASGEILGFIDADCRPLAGWPGQAVHMLLSDPLTGFVGGAIVARPTVAAHPNVWERYDSHIHMRQRYYVESMGFAATANMVTRRSTIEAVGLFDSRLMSGGDRDWAERVRAMGLHGRYCEDSAVEHRCRRTLFALTRKSLRLAGQSAVLTQIKGAGMDEAFRQETMFFQSRLMRSTQARRYTDKLCFVIISSIMQLFRYIEIARIYSGGRPSRI